MNLKKISLRVHDVYHASSTHRIGSLTWAYLAGAFVLFTALIAGFANLADEVIEGDTLPFDTALLEAIHSIHTPLLDSIIAIATDSGGVIGVALITMVATTVFAIKRKYRAVVQLLLGVVGAAAINLVLKSLFTRTRPDLWEQIVHEASYSFPSGHAMASSALALSLVLILWHTRARWWVVGSAAVYMLFVGLTRLYLGVHYPSDILAGWILSAAWVALVAILIGTIHVKNEAS